VWQVHPRQTAGWSDYADIEYDRAVLGETAASSADRSIRQPGGCTNLDRSAAHDGSAGIGVIRWGKDDHLVV
jgi:hypothetical protein